MTLFSTAILTFTKQLAGTYYTPASYANVGCPVQLRQAELEAHN